MICYMGSEEGLYICLHLTVFFLFFSRSMESKNHMIIERATIELGSTGSTEKNECVRNITIGEEIQNFN